MDTPAPATQKIKRKMYLSWDVVAHRDEGGEYRVRDFRFNDPACKQLGVYDMEFDAPMIDGRGELIEALKREKDEVIQKATRRVQQIEEQVQHLLALPSA